MRDDPEWIGAVRRYFGELCFACGQENPIGLHLRDLEVDRGGVSGAFTPRPHYRGSSDTLHGGIAATAIDEICVWAGIMSEGVLTVTGTLDLRYRAPLRVDDRITATGRVESRSGRRLAITGILQTGGRIAAEGRGIFLVTANIDDLLTGTTNLPAHR